MKRIIKSRIFLVIVTAIICTSIGVYAASYAADQISYKSTTVKLALDYLYKTVPKKFCELKSGDSLQIGSKYECDPGDGTKRNFYVLAVDTNKVKLIMEHSITEGSNTTTMTWMNAMKYFDTGAGSSTKTAWKNVIDIDLPMAQDIANAVGNSSWKVEDKNYDGWFYFDKNGSSYGQTQVANASNLSKYKWLFNYTRECSTYGCDSDTSLGSGEAYGYWTRDVVAQRNAGQAWYIKKLGYMRASVMTNASDIGIRPVITVLKSNLYKVS